jgi:2-polyprenyl-3-methyl-5-hydroxy-6-metoxy-1,4-benzoquinol methylase
MKTLFTRLPSCVLCRSTRLRCALPLAPMPIATPNFRLPSGVSQAQAQAAVALDLFQCEECGHVQVGVIGNPEVQYREYVYETSLSVGLSEHFRRYAAEVVRALCLVPDSLVVEVGSNDGTLLSGFAAAGMRVRGVDPARRIAQAATARGIPTISDYFDDRVARDIRRTSGAAALIVANNVIANIAGLDAFARGVELLLGPDGVFVFETQYGGDVIERALLDTVYHEHISYFFLKPTQQWLSNFGLELIDVEAIETKGGSLRAFAQKANGSRPVSAAVAKWCLREEDAGMSGQAFFDRLGARIVRATEALNTLADAEHRNGRSVGGFGVSVGTSTLLAQFRLGEKIDFLVDDDPKKDSYLAGPGYRIPVITGDRILERDARTIVVFAWRYIEPIRRRHAAFLEGGGCFVLPLPDVTIERAEPSGAVSPAHSI